MRQYRGLTKEGKLVHGWYCKVDGKHYVIPDAAEMLGAGWEDDMNAEVIYGFIEIIPKTVGQSTGLKDWYAGDIIQKGEIIRAITVDYEHGFRFMLGKHILCKQDALNGIKIGNIHQNPKLLGR